MPTPKKGARLGGSPAHQRLILANLSTQLFEHGRITTTEAKARVLRPYAEKLITKARKAHAGENALHQRREVLKVIRDKGVVHELFTEIAPAMAERPGGYTRITKLGPRKGDNAPMAVIELVTEPYTPATPSAQAVRSTPVAAAAPAAPAEVVEDSTDEPAEVEVTDAADSAVADDVEAEAPTDAPTDAPTEMVEEASPEESVVAEAEPTEAEPTEDEKA